MISLVDDFIGGRAAYGLYEEHKNAISLVDVRLGLLRSSGAKITIRYNIFIQKEKSCMIAYY